LLLVACGAYVYYRQQKKPVAEEDISSYHELKDMKPKGTNLDGNNPGAPGAPDPHIAPLHFDGAAIPMTSIGTDMPMAMPLTSVGGEAAMPMTSNAPVNPTAAATTDAGLQYRTTS
jgi:hypothetical protein